MLFTNLKSGAAFVLLCGALGVGWISGCSSTQEGGGDCVTRCTAIADKCGGKASKCEDSCQELTDKQLTCIEKADCDGTKSLACLATSSKGTDDTAESTDDTGSEENDCVSRCTALAKKCKTSSKNCERDCPKITTKQLECMEDAECDSDAQLACLMPKDGGTSTVNAGVFAANVYETSKVGIYGYASIVDDYVMKLSLYIQKDGTYVVYYREGQGTISGGGSGFTGAFAEAGTKLTGKWTVSGSTLTVGDVLLCTKSTTIECELKKDIEPQTMGIKVPMLSTISKAPDDATEWKAYTK